LTLAVAMVCFGLALASTGEVRVAWQGVILQLTAMVLEGFRAVRLKTLIKASGASIDSLGMLQLLSPVSAALLYVPAALVDFQNVWEYTKAHGWAVHAALACNTAVAFALNLAALHMLREVAVLTASLAGVFKDCLIIWTSLALGDGNFTVTNAAGWLTSVVGLCWYAFIRSKT
jgi:Triose-phosphate Transporter family